MIRAFLAGVATEYETVAARVGRQGMAVLLYLEPRGDWFAYAKTFVNREALRDECAARLIVQELAAGARQVRGPRGEGEAKMFDEGIAARNAEIVEKLRAKSIVKTEATEFRGPYLRCSECSLTWDEDGTEKHKASCILVPFGCVTPAIFSDLPAN